MLKTCKKGLHRYDPDSPEYHMPPSKWGMCPECRRACDARYNASEKGKATEARYNASEKRKASKASYEVSRINVRVGGLGWSYRVPPEKKEALLALLAEQRVEQQLKYKEAADVGFNPPVA